jgi:hypothetical protein
MRFLLKSFFKMRKINLSKFHIFEYRFTGINSRNVFLAKHFVVILRLH